MGPLVVPMNPEFLPEGGLLIAGVFAGAAALHFLFTRQGGRAARAGAAGIACFALAFALAKTLHGSPGPPVLRPSAAHTMSLVLGDVVLRVAPSDRYVLSVDDHQFLVLDLQRSGLTATGVVGARNRAATKISRNTFPVSRSGIRPARDAHTLLVQDQGRDIFRVHYAEQYRIEVTGQFFEGTLDESALISCEKGVRWNGRGLAPGTVIDLSHEGAGRIDFARTGSVRVLDPRAQRAGQG